MKNQHGNLAAPFPWFGGKQRVANIVWERFGEVANYVEPFFGSGAVLLGAPEGDRIETVNDKDGYVANFWRAAKHAPEEVAKWADNPVNEADLHARHVWLVNNCADLDVRLMGDPDFFDAKVAGWWVWGLCCWIGHGWCSGKGPWQSVDGKLVHLGNGGRGVNRKLVHLSWGRGVNRKLVHLGDWFNELAQRLSRVRVCCGDFERVLGPSPTFKLGTTAVFLDPPYGHDLRADVYNTDASDIPARVGAWCAANGDNPKLRIALCGYEGEYTLPGWAVVPWKSTGGYGGQGAGRGMDNAHQERIWFSPACLNPAAPTQQTLI